MCLLLELAYLVCVLYMHTQIFYSFISLNNIYNFIYSLVLEVGKRKQFMSVPRMLVHEHFSKCQGDEWGNKVCKYHSLFCFLSRCSHCVDVMVYMLYMYLIMTCYLDSQYFNRLWLTDVQWSSSLGTHSNSHEKTTIKNWNWK